MPSDLAGWRSLVLIVDLCYAALSGQNPAKLLQVRGVAGPGLPSMPI
jgi:hypothetical protein